MFLRSLELPWAGYGLSLCMRGGRLSNEINILLPRWEQTKHCVAPVSSRTVTRRGGPCKVARRADRRGFKLEVTMGGSRARSPAPSARPQVCVQSPAPTRRPGRQPLQLSGCRAQSGRPTRCCLRTRARAALLGRRCLRRALSLDVEAPFLVGLHWRRGAWGQSASP